MTGHQAHGDGALVEFGSVVDAVRCAIEVQDGMQERNAGLPPDRRIEFRIGVHLGDVVEESDGDLMGDGVNIAARRRDLRAGRRSHLGGRLALRATASTNYPDLRRIRDGAALAEAFSKGARLRLAGEMAAPLHCPSFI